LVLQGESGDQKRSGSVLIMGLALLGESGDQKLGRR